MTQFFIDKCLFYNQAWKKSRKSNNIAIKTQNTYNYLFITFRIYTLTWNTNAKYPPENLDCRNLLGIDDENAELPDIYSLGYKNSLL